VVAAALATVRRAKHPGAPPVGCLETLRSWCAAMNTHDAAALKATYTPDSDIQSVSDAEIKAGFAAGSPPHQRDWRVTGMKLLGLQLDGVACGWVGYHFMSDDPASMTGSRGHAAFAFLERQPDGRWLIFSPAE
jgi:ketosteroid isomerase-like protein